MSYFCFFLIGLALFGCLAVIPGIIVAFISYSKGKREASDLVLNFSYPYIFVILFSIMFTVGCAITYNAQGLDFIQGDVRKVETQYGIDLSLMDYDMHRAALIHPDTTLEYRVEAIYFSEDKVFFTCEQYTYEIDSVPYFEPPYLYGSMRYDNAQIQWYQDEPAEVNGNWSDPKDIYDSYINDKTTLGCCLSLIISLALSILICWLINKYSNSNKLRI